MDNKSEVKKLSQDTNKTVVKARAVFPFHIFPDTITVDQNKVDIIYKNFFWSKSVFTIFLDDLINVTLSTGPFFATLKFEVRGYEQNPDPVTFLWKTDAVKLHKTIVGLTAVKRRDIDIGSVPQSVIDKYIPNIGKTHENIEAIV